MAKKKETDQFKHLAPKGVTFYPKAAYKQQWDETDFAPVAVVAADGACEQVEKGEEHFWSVYIHLIEGGLSCIADLPTKKQAKQLANLLDELGKNVVKQ